MFFLFTQDVERSAPRAFTGNFSELQFTYIYDISIIYLLGWLLLERRPRDLMSRSEVAGSIGRSVFSGNSVSLTVPCVLSWLHMYCLRLFCMFVSL